MDHRFFEQLREAEAWQYLTTFIAEERKRIPPDWADRLAAEGVDAIEPYFAELVPSINVIQAAPPADLPAFIVESMQRDHGGFREFASEADRIGVLTAAFVFGEAFRSSFPSLSWAVGRPDRAEENQPVVTGFTTDADLPVLEVAENLILRCEPARVGIAVNTWREVI